MQERHVQSLGWEDPLEKKMATHSSILAWETPWTEEPGGLQPMGSQRIGHDLATKQQTTDLDFNLKSCGQLLSNPHFKCLWTCEFINKERKKTIGDDIIHLLLHRGPLPPPQKNKNKNLSVSSSLVWLHVCLPLSTCSLWKLCEMLTWWSSTLLKCFWLWWGNKDHSLGRVEGQKRESSHSAGMHRFPRCSVKQWSTWCYNGLCRPG